MQTMHRFGLVGVRTIVIGGLCLTGVALLAGCGSGGGDGVATLPPGVSAPSVSIAPPGDVANTGAPEAPIETTPATEPAPPVDAAPATDPAAPVDAAPTTNRNADLADEALAAAAADDETVWWPWALGILLLVGIAALILSRSGRKKSVWSDGALSAIEASEAITMHLLAIAPTGLVMVARDDAQRLADLDVTTQDLAQTAPNERARGALDGLRGPLAQLHAALDMVALSPAPTPDQLALVHQWANALHVAAATARSALTTPSG